MTQKETFGGYTKEQLLADRPDEVDELKYCSLLLDTKDPECIQLASILLATRADAVRSAVTDFDPVRVWREMEAAIGAEPVFARNQDYSDFQMEERVWRIKMRAWLEKYRQEVLGYDPHSLTQKTDFWSRILAVSTAEAQLENIRTQGERVMPGFEPEEVFPLAEAAELVAWTNKSHQRMKDAVREGAVTKQYVPTNPYDAMYMASMLQVLEMVHGISTGSTLVDLGSGDGMVATAFALAGRKVVGIEQDQLLVRQANTNLALLKAAGVQKLEQNPPIFMQDRFSLHRDQNSEQVLGVLQRADVFFCYPWADEVRDRITLFHRYAKSGAVLILYEPTIDFAHGFASNFIEHEAADLISQLGLENLSIAEQQGFGDSPRMGTAQFGFAWWALRKPE